MARPIKETSILCGEDAKRFEERMKNVQKETPEQKKIRLSITICEQTQVGLDALSEFFVHWWHKPSRSFLALQKYVIIFTYPNFSSLFNR